jgi:predicted metal-dependent hydrolase
MVEVEPANPSADFDPLYLKGIEYFNACDFFEAHETWEELWTEYRGPDRKFYQGLIQAAVALHHFGNGNLRGARKVYLSSVNYLSQYPDHHQSLDLRKFLTDYEACFAEVLAEVGASENAELIPDLIPEIHLRESG